MAEPSRKKSRITPRNSTADHIMADTANLTPFADVWITSFLRTHELMRLSFANLAGSYTGWNRLHSLPPAIESWRI